MYLLEQLSVVSQIGLPVWIAHLSHSVCKIGVKMRSLLCFHSVTFPGRPCCISPLPDGHVPAHRCQGTARRSSLCQQCTTWWVPGQAVNIKEIVWQDNTPSAGGWKEREGGSWEWVLSMCDSPHDRGHLSMGLTTKSRASVCDYFITCRIGMLIILIRIGTFSKKFRMLHLTTQPWRKQASTLIGMDWDRWV